MTRRTGALHYVATVLRLYLGLPDTPPRARPHDRRLARVLHDRGVDLALVERALLLATARRHARPPTAAPLGPVRSLSYFLPIIDELNRRPLPDGYLEYLRTYQPTGDRPENDVSS